MKQDIASKYNFKHIKKLALGIMGFEGSEHIYNILHELKDLIDYVIIAILDISYHGKPISLTDSQIIYDLYHKEHMVDHILNIELDLTKEPRKQETDKRNKIMEHAEQNGCSHIIIIDADEYYNKESFLNALKTIDEHDYDITYCQYINYYKDYMHYLVYPFKNGMYVPFVSKTSYRHVYNGSDFNMPSDPTRRYVRKKDAAGNYIDSLYVFAWNEVKMHHLSWIRNNINGKLSAWSAKTCFDNLNNMLDNAIYDFNHFSDNIKKVHLIFNTPDNSVEVSKFPKQYLNPVKDISSYKLIPELKNILVINMSTTVNNGFYELLEQSCRDTWAENILKNKWNNIVYYSVIDTTDETYLDTENHKVYVHQADDEDNISCLTKRYMIAVKLILEQYNQKIDYIVKTNTSTWLNIEKINHLLSNITNDCYLFGFRLECAFWSKFNIYLQGNLTIMSKRTFNILDSELKQLDTISKMPDVSDDVLIGSTLSTRLTQLNIPLIENLKVLPCENLKYMTDDFNTSILDNYAVLVKSFTDDNISANIKERLYWDIRKMNNLHKEAKTYNYTYSDNFDDILNPKQYKVNIYKYLKNEWLGMDETIKQQARFNSELTFDSYADLYKTIRGLKDSAGYK